MEQLEKVDYDSDIIICDNIPETISISSTPDKHKKPKTKTCKRKVKRGINFNNNMETLLITQKMKLKKLKVKKTKFKCIININTVCKERGDSIVRSNNNVCKREAYYHRIVPVCLRKMCSGDSASCCRSTMSRNYKYLSPKARSLSPVSSIDFTEIIDITCNDISYEDVSNGNFSTASEEELDTLIKRTRQREKQIDDLYSARDITSTPISKLHDIPSPFSIEERKSIHSDNTMILNPLLSEVYLPTLNIKNTDTNDLENINDTSNDLIVDVPYSPSMSLDFDKVENSVYSPSRTNDILEDDTSYTPRSIEIEYADYESDRNLAHTENDAPYSPTFTPDFAIENLDNTIQGSFNIEYGNDILEDDTPYTPTYTPRSIEIEYADYERDRNLTHTEMDAPYSPTFTSDFAIENLDNTTRGSLNIEYGNEPYSPTMTPDMIKMEKFNDVEGTNVNESVNIGYSPRSPTKTPDFKYEINQTEDSNDNVSHTHTVISKVNNRESSGDERTDIKNDSSSTILNSDLIKKENKDSQEDRDSPPECNGKDYDYTVNNIMYFKSEKYNDQRENASEIVMNTFRADHASIHYVHSTTLNNNYTIKTEQL